MNREVREFISYNISSEKYKDLGENWSILNDINEPAVFDSPINTMLNLSCVCPDRSQLHYDHFIRYDWEKI